MALATKVSESEAGEMNTAGLQRRKSLDNNDNKLLSFTEHQNVPATELGPSHALSPHKVCLFTPILHMGALRL